MRSICGEIDVIKRLTQITTEEKYDKKNIRGHIINDMVNMAEQIAEGIELVNIYRQKKYYKSKNKRISNLKEPSDVIVIEVFIRILQLTKETSIQNVVGPLAWLGGNKDMFDNVKTVSELVAVICETDVYDIRKKEGRLTVIPKYQPEEEVLQYIADTKYLPPLICRPIMKRLNMDSAYLTKEESVILGSGNHHKGQQCLEVLNILQDIPLELDLHVLNEKEESKKLLDTQEKRDNFNRIVKASRKVYEYLLEEGNKFYFDWRYDKRGRFYCSGYHVNIQGNEYRKALINLHHKEVINCEV